MSCLSFFMMPALIKVCRESRFANATSVQAHKAGDQADHERRLYQQLHAQLTHDAAKAIKSTNSNIAPSLTPASKRASSLMTALEGQLRRHHKVDKAVDTKERILRFFHKRITLKGKERRDMYLITFLVQFLTLLMLLVGWSAFESEDDASGGITENNIPPVLLISLILQFAMMVLDRVFYLKRSMLGKLVLHYVLVFGIHIYIFFLLPIATNRSLPSNSILSFIYVLYVVYWILSSLQVHYVLHTPLISPHLFMPSYGTATPTSFWATT